MNPKARWKVHWKVIEPSRDENFTRHFCRWVYLILMENWAKIIVVTLIAVVAAASTVQIAQATVMDIQMSVPADAGGGCPDCPTGPDGTGMTCASGCTISSVGLPAVDFPSLRAAPLEECPAPVAMAALKEWRTPPDPFPPKRLS